MASVRRSRFQEVVVTYVEFPARTLEHIEYIIVMATLMLVAVALYIDHKGFR